jgi:hypothetical protein
VNGAERFRDQCRTNQPRWVAGAERNQPTAPALRHRQRKEIAHEIDDILEIVGEADPLDRVGTHTRAIGLGQTDRPADPCMKADIFGERRRYHALTDIGLDQHVRLAVLGDAAEDRTTKSAECDHVDWVRYLMTPEMLLLPSTRSTSPGSSDCRKASGSLGVNGS